ncbi:MAG: tetratricopeptide repeat protein [Gemmataceae bacterium]
MAFAIHCPRCQSRLKAASAPAPGKIVACPQCGHRFIPEPTDAAASSSMPWIFGGAVGLVLLIAGGIGAARWINSRTADPTLLTSTTQKPAEVEKKASPIVVKEEPKKEDAKKLDPEPEKKTEDNEKQKLEYIRLMIEGGVASAGKNHEEAMTAYSAALKLYPKDAEATKKFDEAKSSWDVIVKAKQADEKSKQELDTLIVRAQESLEKKQYAAATDLFKLALERSPSDDRAIKGFTASREALAKNQDDTKKLNDVQALIDSGKASLKQGRYADAIRDFSAATRLDPTNPLPGQFQKDAEKSLDNLKNDQEKKAEFQKLLDQGNAASKGQRYDDAEQAYRQALKLYPTDKIASNALDDVRRLAKIARSEFDAVMVRGNLAMRDGRFRDASDAYRDALRIMPANEIALKAARDADRLSENVSIYMQAMTRATTAMSLKRWLDATRAYQDALRANPGDPSAAQGLVDAQRALEAEVLQRRDFDKHANAGLQYLKTFRYSDAADEFQQAVKAFPNHPQADVIARNRRYADAMGRGVSAMQANRYSDAVRNFQTALSEIPGDFAAQNRLQQARTLAQSNPKGKS